MSNALPPSAAPAGAPARWRLRLLGDVALLGPGGRQLALPGRTGTALLARLALAPQRAHPREELVELLWPGVALDVGRNRLRQLLATLKRLFDAAGDSAGPILADRQALRLDGQWLDSDALAFEAALAAGRLHEARALYRGELLPGFYDDWVLEARRRLAARAEALEAASLAPPSPLPAAAPAALRNLPHALTAVHGVDATGARLQADLRSHRLVTLLGPGGVGKTRLAVEVARWCAGAAPRPEAAGALGASAPVAAAPFDLVAFVPAAGCDGPEALLDSLLLVLGSPAQAGSALARIQAQLADRRCLLVLDNLEHIAEACAGMVATLLAHCPGMHLLVTSRRVLGIDGEHPRPLGPLALPPADAAEAPGTAVLNPAVALFIDRARNVRPDLVLDAAQLAAVVALVRRLHGLPLAIELAAARVRSFSPVALLALLEDTPAPTDTAASTPTPTPTPAVPAPAAGATSSLPPLLRLLDRPGPRAPGDARQASVLAVVDWSWRLLSPAAQALLPQLAVFAGSFSAPAVQALGVGSAVDVALALDELVAQSMLRTEPLPPAAPPRAAAALTPPPPRFALEGLVREVAASRLAPAEARALRARLRLWLAGWARAQPPSVPLHWLRPELPTLVALWRSAPADGDTEAAASLLLASESPLGAVALPPDALALLADASARLADPVLRACCRATLARRALLAGENDQALQLADAALSELPAADAAAPPGLSPGASPARALVLVRAAHVRWRLLHDPRAAAWLDEALPLARAQGARTLEAAVLANQGAVLRRSQPQRAAELQRAAIACAQAAGDLPGVLVGRCNLAIALQQQRSGCTEALDLLQQVQDETRAWGDSLQQAVAANLRGEAWSRLGQWHAAARAYQECVSVAWAAGEPWPLRYGLWNLPRAWVHLGRAADAARLMAFAARWASPSGPPARADAHDLRRLRRLCALQLPAAALQRQQAEGAGLSLAQAVQLALSSGGDTRRRLQAA